jgi:hypothetical protein
LRATEAASGPESAPPSTRKIEGSFSIANAARFVLKFFFEKY